MALALDAPLAGAPARPAIHTGTFAVASFASLGAGAIHAAAIGVHAEHPRAAFTFAVVALFQLGAGAAALLSHRRFVGVALAVGNAALLGGWVLAKTSSSGISFVAGLDVKEPLQWADGLAAAMAAFVVLAVAVAVLRGWQFPHSDAVVRVLALPVAALTLTGMLSAGQHAHAREHIGVAANAEPTAAVPPTPFVPGRPINLGGVPGVTPLQQAQAENVLAASLYKLPQFADPAVAEARGWISIGDGFTGDEHFVNTSTFDDGKILDPDAPESLVFEMRNGVKTLVAAMYMMPPDATLDQVPKIGGKLMQWHVHNNLCFTTAGKVAALTNTEGTCDPPLVQGGNTPMIHVWIVSHPCGPFAALEGIAGGTIGKGEARLCDHVHGATSR